MSGFRITTALASYTNSPPDTINSDSLEMLLFLALLTLLPLVTSFPTQALAHRQARECRPENPAASALLPTLAAHLTNLPTITLPPFTSGYLFHNESVSSPDGGCLQLLVLNQDVFFPVNITGAGLVATANDIAAECPTGLGWDNYRDAETGWKFYNAVVAVLTRCDDDRYPKSGGRRVICPTDTMGGERHDPAVRCPGE